MKLGVNSVLFKPFPVEEALRLIKMAGYDGVEIAAIKGMCEHLDLDNMEESVAKIRKAQEDTGLELLSMELASQDPIRLRKACKAAKMLGIPVINVGPTGKTGVEGDLEECIETLKNSAAVCSAYGITLCCKAHVGASLYNTETTLAAMDAIKNEAFGVDMDPSHIYRAGELPEKALPQVISRVKHIHIRDCVGRGPGPGAPLEQTCGVGEIDLYGYFKALAEAKYEGPVCLEVIGPDQPLEACMTIAAESYGYMNACLKTLGAR